MISFPKLLVIAEFAPNGHGGGEALIRQLLRGYPPEQIYWWSCRPGPRGDDGGQPAHKHYLYRIPARIFPNRMLPRTKSWLLETFWSPRAAAHLRNVVNEVKPQQIWSVLHGWAAPALYMARLMGAHRTHVSIWDYPDTRSHCALLGSRRAARMLRIYRELYKTADSCDVISQSMLDDMAQRTSRSDAIIVHSGFEPWHLQSFGTSETEPSPDVAIAYAGTIIVPEVFRFFVTGLQKIRGNLRKPLRLEFFGGRSHRREPWFDKQWMREHDHLDEADFHQRIRACNWGFAPMGLSDDDPRYNRFSFPNKFGTYLAAGLPLIVLAHRESTAAKMMQANAIGAFTDTTDLGELALFLERTLAEPDPKRRFRDAILSCATAQFDAARMRRRLWSAFGVAGCTDKPGL